MKDSTISLHSKFKTKIVIEKINTLCEKCGGSGNLKTPENNMRTCLKCFGRGYQIL